MDTPFTCITCRLVFEDLPQQKSHYQTAWHCFNLKRKVAGLAPVTQEVFDEKVAALKSDTEGQKPKKAPNSKKHYKGHRDRKRLAPASNPAGDQGQQEAEGEETEPVQKTEEELVAERLKTAKAIPVTDSLFDNHQAQNLEANLEHMRKKFGFFIPDVDYLVDLEGLIAYLGEKIGIGYACIYCPREFQSVGAAQSHMVDKCHCKINFYGHEEEFQDFYDWSSLLGEDAASTDDKEKEGAVNADAGKQIIAVTEESLKGIHLTETGGELVLPSGVTIGNRAFTLYYKQKHRPSDTRLSVLANQLARQYRDLGIVKAQTDMDYRARRRKELQWMQLGIKANKLPKFMKHSTHMC